MGTNFRGWLNFAVFKGTSQTVKNNPGEIFVRLCPHKNIYRRWARQAREWRSFVNFVQPLTTGETPCVVFLRHHLFTDPRVIRKGRGNYTHNKSAKMKTYENLINYKDVSAKTRNFNPTKFCTHTVTENMHVHCMWAQPIWIECAFDVHQIAHVKVPLVYYVHIMGSR